jgi:hypothetical protein
MGDGEDCENSDDELFDRDFDKMCVEYLSAQLCVQDDSHVYILLCLCYLFQQDGGEFGKSQI